MTRAQEAAQAGARFLDQKYTPSWRDLVDPSTLDMNNISYCVLGQVEGDWGTACRIHFEHGVADSRVHEFGFDMIPGVSMDALTAAWLEVLAT